MDSVSRFCPVRGHVGHVSTSLMVTTRSKLPLMPLYAPVPEPVATGALAFTTSTPEQVFRLVGNNANAATRRFSSAVISRANEPRETFRSRRLYCWAPAPSAEVRTAVPKSAIAPVTTAVELGPSLLLYAVISTTPPDFSLPRPPAPGVEDAQARADIDERARMPRTTATRRDVPRMSHAFCGVAQAD